MDAKITKLRLSRMLSYDWLKIIGTAAAAIVVWVLIFTMTATAITPAQTFTVGNYLGNVTFSDEFSKAFNNAYNDNVFTGEILDVDGQCGGFNLQWAYSSAMRVARALEKV